MTTATMQPPEPAAEPAAELAANRSRSRREIYTAMSGLVIAMLLAMLDNLIVGTAMPTIVGQLGGLDRLAWVVTAYTLTTAASTPIWGKLGDLYGRKRVHLCAIALFTAASVACGFAQDMTQLIAFRAVRASAAAGSPSARCP